MPFPVRAGIVPPATSSAMPVITIASGMSPNDVVARDEQREHDADDERDAMPMQSPPACACGRGGRGTSPA